MLIIDAELAGAERAGALLEAAGCTVRRAGSAEEALTLLPTFAPEVIVLDLLLPLMSGLLLTQTLKTNPATREIAIIATGAFDGATVGATALAAGCASYVKKPIDALTLAGLVQRLSKGTR